MKKPLFYFLLFISLSLFTSPAWGANLGDALWLQTVSGSNINGLAVDSEDNVIVAGATGSWGIAKYDPNGNLLWSRQDIEALGVAADSNDNIYVVYNQSIYPYAESANLYKLNKNGDILWSEKIGGGDIPVYGSAVAVDKSGFVYMTGYTTGMINGGTNRTDKNKDLFLAKYDINGTLKWVSQYYTDFDDYEPLSIMNVDGAGNIFVGGYGDINSLNEFFVKKIDKNGNALWNYFEWYPFSLVGFSMDKDMNFYTVGSGGGSPFIKSTNYDYVNSGKIFLIKHAPTKSVIYKKQCLDDDGVWQSGNYCAAMGSSGYIFVGGGICSSNGESLYMFYPNGAGVPVFVNWPWYFDYKKWQINKMALDGRGNAYIAGTSTYSQGGNQYSDVYLMKLRVESSLSLAESQDGAKIKCSAKFLSAANSPITNIGVNFYEQTGNGSFNFIGSAPTEGAGTAVLNFNSTVGQHAVLAQAEGFTSNTVSCSIGKVTVTSPLNGQIVTSAPTLYWQPYIGGTGAYHIQVATAPAFGTANIYNTDVSSTSYTIPSALVPGTTYYWRVFSYLDNGGSMYSNTSSFTYKLATSLTLSLVSQVGNTVNLKTTLTRTDTGAPLPNRVINIFDGPTFVATGTTLANGTVTIPIASTAGFHNFTARFPGDASHVRIVSGAQAVTLGRVTLVSPSNLGLVTAPKPLLSWSAYNGSTGNYHIQLATAPTFGTAMIYNADVNATSYAIPSALILGKTYYWRVFSYLNNGKSMFSNTQSFTYKLPTSLALSLVSQNGNTVNVKATFTRSDTGALVGGRALTFYENTNGGAFTSKGTVTTGLATSANPGVATKSWTTSVGAHQAYSKFQGDAIYAPASTDPASVSYVK